MSKIPNYRRMARRAANRYGLDPDIFERQIQQESGFAEDVIHGRRTSSAGAQGIAQIMPATARGWGVDPLNPKAALNAAAKNMASYVKKYGGYENALRAYNAGPGAIQASKGYAETNNYVKTILRGGDPGPAGVTPSTGGGGGRRGAELRFSPGQAVDLAALLSSVREGADRPQPGVTAPTAPAFSASAVTPEGYQAPSSAGAPQSKVDSLTEALKAIALSTPTDVPGAVGTGGEGGGGTGGGGGTQISPKGDIKELFWNGPGATNIDENKAVGKGFVSGHTDHVHLAADRGTMKAAAKLARNLGLNVGEYGKGISSGHATGSFHYQPYGAMDVSGDTAKMKRFAKLVAKGRI